MKRTSRTLALAVLGTMLTGCFGKFVKEPMTIEQTKNDLRQLAEEAWALKPLACPKEFELEGGNMCFSVDEEAEEFGSRVEAVESDTLRPITGWRDDYGTLSGIFEYKGQPYEVAIRFTRPTTFWDQPNYAELVERKSKGYVSILVTDEPPRDR